MNNQYNENSENRNNEVKKDNKALKDAVIDDLVLFFYHSAKKRDKKDLTKKLEGLFAKRHPEENAKAFFEKHPRIPFVASDRPDEMADIMRDCAKYIAAELGMNFVEPTFKDSEDVLFTTREPLDEIASRRGGRSEINDMIRENKTKLRPAEPETPLTENDLAFRAETYIYNMANAETLDGCFQGNVFHPNIPDPEDPRSIFEKSSDSVNEFLLRHQENHDDYPRRVRQRIYDAVEIPGYDMLTATIENSFDEFATMPSDVVVAASHLLPGRKKRLASAKAERERMEKETDELEKARRPFYEIKAKPSDSFSFLAASKSAGLSLVVFDECSVYDNDYTRPEVLDACMNFFAKNLEDLQSSKKVLCFALSGRDDPSARSNPELMNNTASLMKYGSKHGIFSAHHAAKTPRMTFEEITRDMEARRRVSVKSIPRKGVKKRNAQEVNKSSETSKASPEAGRPR